MKPVVITMSRQLGSGGSFIGEAVARALGIRYFDREILAQAAQVLQEDPAVLEKREERVSGFLEDFFRNVPIASPDAGYIPPAFPIIYDEDIMRVEAQIIREMARNNSAVIVGRAGFHILKGVPGVINLFFHAPLGERQRRVAEIYRVDRGRAEQMIGESDADRRKFIEKVTGGDWWDARNFHLCIDTSAAGLTWAVDSIVRLAKDRQE